MEICDHSCFKTLVLPPKDSLPDRSVTDFTFVWIDVGSHMKRTISRQLTNCRIFFVMSCGFLGLAPHAICQIQIESVSRSENQLKLEWSGGMPPFQLEQSVDLQEWKPTGTTTESLEATIDMEEGQIFYRIQGATDIELGEHVGQLRVDQGEFGLPLARHRQKSIWDFYLPKEGATQHNAEGYFADLIVKIQYLDGTDMRNLTTRFGNISASEFVGVDKTLTTTFTLGSGDNLRECTLEMKFPYEVKKNRLFEPFHLSDPQYKWTCRYKQPVREVDRSGKSVETREDVNGLVEIADDQNAPGWWNRAFEITKNGVTVDTRFTIGVPNYRGQPAFIFKTPLLTKWDRTVITGLTTEPIELKSRFSQTYLPFHHNFVETVYLDPSLEPGIPEDVLSELRNMDVRFIIATNPSAFPEQNPTLGIMGFDGAIRKL